MLRVTVTLLPFGSERGKREIARMDIGNVGGTDEVGEYDVRAYETARHEDRTCAATTRRITSGHVSGYERYRPVWELVRLAIEGMK